MVETKKILFILSFIFLLSGVSFSDNYNMLFPDTPRDTSQAYLQLIRRNTGKTVRVSAGKMVTVWAKNQKFRGIVTKVTYDKIYINNAPFLISDIYHIKVKNTLYSILGVSMEVYGGLISFAGMMIISTYADPTGIFLVAEGGLIIWWGTDIFKGKNYKNKNWEYKSNEADIEMNFISE